METAHGERAVRHGSYVTDDYGARKCTRFTLEYILPERRRAKPDTSAHKAELAAARSSLSAIGLHLGVGSRVGRF